MEKPKSERKPLSKPAQVALLVIAIFALAYVNHTPESEAPKTVEPYHFNNMTLKDKVDYVERNLKRLERGDELEPLEN